MKPIPLPPDPKLIDRAAHALRSLLCWAIIYWPERPMLSGLITGVLLSAPAIGIVILFAGIAQGQLNHLVDVLQQTGHWKP
jgi:hypothetical protein